MVLLLQGGTSLEGFVPKASRQFKRLCQTGLSTSAEAR